MSNPILPQPFWFRLTLPCPRVAAIPRPDGMPNDLPAAATLLSPGALNGNPSWVTVRAGWNPKSLGFCFEVAGKKRAAKDKHSIINGESVHLWIDTRDARNNHRASRFCHHFVVRLEPRGQSVDVGVTQATIARATADAPISDLKGITTHLSFDRDSWRLDIVFSKEALSGYDPETNRRLGFAYAVSDMKRADVCFPVGRDFPLGEDPSLWATLELVDP